MADKPMTKAQARRADMAEVKENVKAAYLALADLPTLEKNATKEQKDAYEAKRLSIVAGIQKAQKVAIGYKTFGEELRSLNDECLDRSFMFGADLLPEVKRMRKPREGSEVPAVEEDPLDF